MRSKYVLSLIFCISIYIGKSQEKGADEFVEFIKDEPTPFIDSTYGTALYRILGGHSSDAIYSSYALLKSPESFDAALLELYRDWRIRPSYDIPFDISRFLNWQSKMKVKFGYSMRIPASIIIQRAMMLFFDRKYEESLPYFQYAVDQYPNEPEVYLWLARNQNANDMKDDAIDTIDQAILIANELGMSRSRYDQFK